VDVSQRDEGLYATRSTNNPSAAPTGTGAPVYPLVSITPHTD